MMDELIQKLETLRGHIISKAAELYANKTVQTLPDTKNATTIGEAIDRIKELELQLDKFRTMYIPSCKHEVRHRINEILRGK